MNHEELLAMDLEALANEPLDLVAPKMPYTFTRDDRSYYTLPNRFESLTDNFQSMNDLFNDKKSIEAGIAEDDAIIEKIKQNLLQVAEHRKQLEGYLAECVEDIKTMHARIKAPSLMIVKDYKMVQIGNCGALPRLSRHILYRLFTFYYDSEGNVVTSQLIKDDIPATDIKAIVDEYIDSGKVSKVEYFDGLRVEKKTTDKWIRKYLEEEKIVEVK